jgi:hypothetical protein
MFDAERIVGFDFAPTLSDFFRPPFRKFEFSTPMSIAHAARVLQEIVEPPRKWGSPTSTKRGFFEGRVATGGRFKIHRVINYQNSFVPIIEGNFRRDQRGTLVTLNMRLVWPVVPVWFGIMLFLAWSSVSVDSPLAGPFGVRMLLLAMTLVIYLVATIPFAIEMRIAMKRLLELLRSEPAI